MKLVHDVKSIFFDSKQVPSPHAAWVVWLDLMGTQSLLQRSLPTAANAVFKLHAAALEEAEPALHLYPVMDGIYIVAADKSVQKRFLNHLFSRIAAHFIEKTDKQHRFLPKAAVAFGPVIHGAHVKSEASAVFKKNLHYKESLLIGAPMVRALLREQAAPPFGVAVDATGQGFPTQQERKVSHVWWPWYRASQQALISDLKIALNDYYDWCMERAGAIAYDRSRIAAHREAAREYLDLW